MSFIKSIVLLAVAAAGQRLPELPLSGGGLDGASQYTDLHFEAERSRHAEILNAPSCVDDPFGFIAALGGCPVVSAVAGCTGDVPSYPLKIWMLCPNTCNMCYCADSPLVMAVGGCSELSSMGCNRVLSDLGVTQTVGDLCPSTCNKCPTTPGNTTIDQKTALVSIYNSASGATWTRNDNWLQGDPCEDEWAGVGCNAGNIVALRLDSNNLQGTLSTEVSKLVHLTVLDVSSNIKLIGAFPSIRNLVNLQRFITAEAQLTGALPDFSGQVNTMTHVVFGQLYFPREYPPLLVASHYQPKTNVVSESQLDEFLKLKNLKIVSAASSFLSGTISEQWCSHASIEELHLTQTSVVGTIPDCVSQKLVKLQIRDIDLTGTLPDSLFASDSKLQFIEAGSLAVTGTIPSTIGDSKAFKVLYFHDLQLSGTIPEGLCEMSDMLYVTWGDMPGLSGTLPASCGGLKKTQAFGFYSANITGTIPQEYESLTELSVLYFHDLDLSGTLPDIFSGMTKLRGLYLNLNEKLGGTLPTSAVSRPFQATLAATSCNFTGSLPEVVSPKLFFIGLALNSFSGTLPASWCTMQGLGTMWLHNNVKLDGAIPDCIGSMSKMFMLRLDNNSFSGTIPSTIASAVSLETFSVESNMLSGSVPDLAQLPKIRHAMYSGNPLNIDINTFLESGAKAEQLTTIGGSRCGLTGMLRPSTFYTAGSGSGVRWKSLQRFLIGHNSIQGSLPSTIDVSLFTVTFFDVSHNNLTGALPTILVQADGILSDGNPLMKGRNNGSIPNYAKSSERTTGYPGNYDCKILEGVNKELIIRVDPSYFGYSYCSCSVGFWGTPPNCKPCLANGICSGGESVLTPAGYYPYPVAEPELIQRCYDDAVNSNPCNPDNADPWVCKDGYKGRLCGRCGDGFYSVGRRCEVCPSDAGIVVLMASIILIAIGVVLSVRGWSKRQQLLDLMRLGVFFAQVQAVLLSDSSFLWPVSVKSSLSGPFQYAMVSPTVLSCLAGMSWFSFEGSVTSVAIVTVFWVVLILVFLVGGWWMLRTHVKNLVRVRSADYILSNQNSSASNLSLSDADPSAPDYPSVVVRVCKVALLGTSFLYLPVTVASLSVFQCEEDPGTGKKYMVTAPDTECSMDNSDYELMWKVSVCLIPTVVVGLPVTLIALCWALRDRTRRNGTAYRQMFGFLHSMYNDGCYWYFVFAVLRRLVVATTVSLIPKESEVGLPLLFVALCVFYSHHKAYMPMRVPLMNTLETYSLVTMLVTFSCGSLFSSGLTNTKLTTAVLSCALWPYGCLFIFLLVDLVLKGAASLALIEFAEKRSFFAAPVSFLRHVNQWVKDVEITPTMIISSRPEPEVMGKKVQDEEEEEEV
eukprot:TRINITY_DN2835_c3_g1_i1.p1 TRINITY_DN2835_c3_g1~~TRINITY_DN2835_c3_g1_i1.p1  ORF type:complete len:1367 (+),score=253.83 TRINITY_DN2835_c3_g1_i1:23-4102(+)